MVGGHWWQSKVGYPGAVDQAPAADQVYEIIFRRPRVQHQTGLALEKSVCVLCICRRLGRGPRSQEKG